MRKPWNGDPMSADECITRLRKAIATGTRADIVAIAGNEDVQPDWERESDETFKTWESLIDKALDILYG